MAKVTIDIDKITTVKDGIEIPNSKSTNPKAGGSLSITDPINQKNGVSISKIDVPTDPKG